MTEVTLRDVMRAFPQGVVVVTAQSEEGPRGITVSSFTSVSLTPPRVVICIMTDARAHDAIDRGGFVVNILSERQGSLSDHFATPNLTSEQQFEGLSRRGLYLDGCLGYLGCRVVERLVQGTHTLFVGEVETCSLGAEGGPLVFCGREYWGLGENVFTRS
ncbi:MAG TPA: flavin reductase family protein [Vicinamibacteria bacterium]|nr:flavin reductase family protein [Vicinamibacteria bacterium]